MFLLQLATPGIAKVNCCILPKANYNVWLLVLGGLATQYSNFSNFYYKVDPLYA